MRGLVNARRTNEQMNGILICDRDFELVGSEGFASGLHNVLPRSRHLKVFRQIPIELEFFAWSDNEFSRTFDDRRGP